MRTRARMRNLAAGALITAAIVVLPGCMTVSNQRSIVEATMSGQAFAQKKIAVLPVKAQASLAPDSVMAIRTEINRQIGQTLHGKLPMATLVDFAAVSSQLNEQGVLPVYEQLVATYENTGVVDKQKTAALGRALGSDFLLLARLKAEKLDIVVSRSTGTSLEVSLINASSGEVVWGGSSEWKRGGIFGFGEAKPDEAARTLVNLAFSSLQVDPATGAKAAESQPASTNIPSTPSSSPGSTAGPRSPATPQAGASPSTTNMTLMEAQKRIAALGYDPGPADGKMGARTAAALRRFQSDRGLPVSGKLDPATASALGK
jgi:PBP1b-binding outer membrane lipoprotein LpoB